MMSLLSTPPPLPHVMMTYMTDTSFLSVDDVSTLIPDQDLRANTSWSVLTNTTTAVEGSLPRRNPPQPLRDVMISLYVIIFLLSVLGNSLVIITLVQNRRMRTVTNVFLLNLAVSDLLLGVFCMPFTLVGTLLRNFIFGEFMCKILPFLQAVSVSVSVWTLVAISLERYFAICRPLSSRRWQTLSHAYKMIASVWLGSLVFMIPIASLSRLIPLKSGRSKCREEWPDPVSEKAYNLFLDFLLLILPLIIMIAAYICITCCLWQGMRLEKLSQKGTSPERGHFNHVHFSASTKGPQVYSFRNPTTMTIKCNPSENGEVEQRQSLAPTLNSLAEEGGAFAEKAKAVGHRRRRIPVRHIRSTNYDKSLAAKKHVICMLFVLVLEFFICWSPIFIVNTFILFDSPGVFSTIGFTGISFFHLLSYCSSCCNPITYCFMNRKFRQAFFQAFGCSPRLLRRGTQSSTNGMSFYNRHSTIRTVVEEKEPEAQL